MHDRRFWALALGVFPVAYVALTLAPLIGDGTALTATVLLPLTLLLEGPVLWQLADPAITGRLPRTRRAALGVLLSVLSALIGGGLLVGVLLVLALGPDG
ncbi:MAG: hypothetical protein JWM31_1033 [Solirubrobacterales bacterium]|nr:hypothetical protein [Solirubrobacterales bacterium]